MTVVVKAYSLTSITSVMILNVFTIPSALGLSKVILGSRFYRNHYAALGLSFVSVLIIMINDLLLSDKDISFDKRAIFGDLIVLLSSFLLALSNVLQEKILTLSFSVPNFIGFIGLFGFLISLALSLILGEFTQLSTPRPLEESKSPHPKFPGS